MIKYDKLFALLYASGWNRYKVVKAGIINSKTYQHLQHGEQVSSYTIDRICALLQCQPGDIMEWVPDEDEPTFTSGKEK